jgi:hypothetical protein
MQELTQEQQNRIAEVLHQWHEAGRAEFETRYKSLNWDSPDYSPHYHVGGKYVRLDFGTSGAFMAEIETGTIYGIKGYGVPDKKKVSGNLWDSNFDGAVLLSNRFRRGPYNGGAS